MQSIMLIEEQLLWLSVIIKKLCMILGQPFIRFDDKQPQYYANRGNCMMMLNQINDALA